MKKHLTVCLSLLLYSALATKAHAMSEKYQHLTLKERESVFQTLKMDDSTFFPENLIPFGFASFSRGDILTGTAVCLMDATTLFIMNYIPPTQMGME